MSETDNEFVVLSAEDDPDDRLLIQDAVETIRTPLHLQFVNDGRELLDYLYGTKRASHRLPSLVLLDLNMPFLDGREALKKIRKEDSFRNLPVVVFTTSSEKKDREICDKFGANEFVSKPSSFEDIVAALKGIFSKWLVKSNGCIGGKPA